MMSKNKYINSNQKKIAYKTFDGDDKNHVLFIPGKGSTIELMNYKDSSVSASFKIAEDLFYKYTTFDFSGTGDSEGEDIKWNLEEWIINLCDIIESIDGKIILFGNSMGSILAILAGILYPEKIKSIFIVAPGFGKSFSTTNNPLYLYDRNKIKVFDLKIDKESKTHIDSKLDIYCPVYIFEGNDDDTISKLSGQSIYDNLYKCKEKELFKINEGHKVFKNIEAQKIIKKILSNRKLNDE